MTLETNSADDITRRLGWNSFQVEALDGAMAVASVVHDDSDDVSPVKPGEADIEVRLLRFEDRHITDAVGTAIIYLKMMWWTAFPTDPAATESRLRAMSKVILNEISVNLAADPTALFIAMKTIRFLKRPFEIQFSAIDLNATHFVEPDEWVISATSIGPRPTWVRNSHAQGEITYSLKSRNAELADAPWELEFRLLQGGRNQRGKPGDILRRSERGRLSLRTSD